MTVETAQFINGLNPALPTGASDPITEGDNHLRLIKGAILATFPAISGQVAATHADLSSLLGAATTGANGLNVVTQAATNNGTLAASTAQVQGAIGVAIAPLATLLSPALTGTPTAPTATAGTATGQLATTAFAAALNIVGTAAATASAIASASTATNAAASSAISAGAVIWVTGSTYAVNARVISPSNGRVYMSLAAGVSNTDPASDTRWLLVTTNRVAVAITAATITAISGTHYVMTNAAQSILTLPASPVTGSIVQVTFTNARTDNVISRNGSALLLDSAGNPLLEDMTVDVLNRSVILEYAFNAWRFYLDSTAVASSAVVVTVTQATDAATTATAAATAATTARTAIDNKYRGALAADPATRPDSTANQVGDEYFNTAVNLLKRFNGSIWSASDISTANLAASTGAGLVGFVQAGTGAVARTLQAKEREHVSVLDFYANGVSGAAVDPTGVTDSTLGIQAAITSIKSAGGEIFFPPGTYLVSSPIVTWSNITLTGVRGSTTLKKTSTTTYTGSCGVAINCILYFDVASGYNVYSVVRGLSFLGLASATTGIYLGNTAQAELSNIIINSVLTGISCATAFLCTFTSVRVNSSAFAFDFSSPTSKTTLNFVNCYAEACGGGWNIFGAKYSTMTGCAADYVNTGGQPGNSYGAAAGGNYLTQGYVYYFSASDVSLNGCGCESSTATYIYCESSNITLNACTGYSIRNYFSPTSFITSFISLRGTTPSTVNLNGCGFEAISNLSGNTGALVKGIYCETPANQKFIATTWPVVTGYGFGYDYQNLGNTVPNLLSTYAQKNNIDTTGTWTPTFSSSGGSFGPITYSSQIGRYARVGDLVIANFSILVASVTIGTAVGALQVSGLPFTVSDAEGVANFRDVFTSQGPDFLQYSGTATNMLLRYKTTTGYANCPTTSIQAGSMLQGTVTYFL